MTMSRQHFKIAVVFLALLVVANIISYFCSGWGLITVKAHEVPIGQVIRSIERQGWVRIYTNIDPQTKISMYVDHVTLPEAMETLAVNSDAQWHLGFFVAPNSALVKQEIRTFTEATDGDDDTKIYSFQTPLAMVDDGSLPVADPSKQIWPGVKPAAAAPDPPPASTDAAAAMMMFAPPPDPPPTSVQGYLRAFAQAADVWIAVPSSWDPPVATAPPPASSIGSAITRFVGSMHGSVTQALVLRGRPPRVAGGDQRPRGPRGGGMDFGMMQDRVDNAINGLPPSLQPAARDRLAQELAFQKEVFAMPRDQRRMAWMKHMTDNRLDNDNTWRRSSPEKRAQMFTRLVSNRMAAQGK